MAAAPAASAQGVKVYTKSGEIYDIPMSDLEKIEPYGRPVITNPDAEYVDLGLSVNWATTNVGATTPSEIGEYYMWAQTVFDPALKYNFNNCPYQDQSYNDGNDGDFMPYYLKYCNNQDLGIPDLLYTLQPVDDAATQNWGEAWRMPTQQEMEELVSSCTWTKLTEENSEYPGVAGYKVTGPNGNSIFLPCGGYRFSDSAWYANKELNYWTSSLYSSSCMYSHALTESGYGANKTPTTNFKNRYMGYPIRPVCDKTAE